MYALSRSDCPQVRCNINEEGLHGQRFGAGSNNDVAKDWGCLGLSAGFNGVDLVCALASLPGYMGYFCPLGVRAIEVRSSARAIHDFEQRAGR